MRRLLLPVFSLVLAWLIPPTLSPAWYDETHVAMAKATGYPKWFNAAGPDMIRVKMGNREGHNHFVNNPRGTTVTPEMVKAQMGKYNRIDPDGHLYGAIIRSVQDYIREKKEGKYAEYHLAFCAHYVGDLSQPLHNIEYTAFNQKNHADVDGIINGEVLENLEKIKIDPIKIESEENLIKEVARIGNLSMALGHKLQDENRLLKREEAYTQIGHSASLFKAILGFVGN